MALPERNYDALLAELEHVQEGHTFRVEYDDHIFSFVPSALAKNKAQRCYHMSCETCGKVLGKEVVDVVAHIEMHLAN